MCQDDIWGVRKACAGRNFICSMTFSESLVLLGQALPTENRLPLVQIFDILISDVNSRTIEITLESNHDGFEVLLFNTLDLL
jgi:hypothetical protein